MDIVDPNNREAGVYKKTPITPIHQTSSACYAFKNNARWCQQSCQRSICLNEIFEKHPQYLGLFYQEWYYAHLGEDIPSLSLLFNYNARKLIFRYLRQYFEL
tara:strand:+ start:438 stop:743 length:306 start_codon:yes stop_codon:yes gene_type:complete